MGHDLVIRGGTVVDGTGAPSVRADVAIDGDRIVAVGDVDASGAAEVIEADGRLVTPGFVDLHSHLDAQIGWDPLMSSSCWHGVTSVVMGNCGMTFAPLRPGQAETLANMMESVEDIPASAILQGLDWNWETYGQYLDAVDAMPKGINSAGHVGDVAVRTYVCGEAACDEDFVASPEQLAEMARLVEEGLRAGAVGYSISRSLTHRVPDGRWVPGTWSDPEEFFTIAEPLGRLGKGVLDCAPRYNETDGSTSRVDEEMAWIAELSRRTGRPFTFNLAQMQSLGDHYRRVVDLSTQANETGAQLRPQTTPRSIGILFSLAANTLVDNLPSFAPLKQLDAAGRLAAIRDPEVRERLVAEAATQPGDAYGRMFLMEPDAGAVYRYGPDDSIAAQAAAHGMSPIAWYLDVLDRTDGAAVANWPVLNQDFDAIEELMTSPVTVMGLADAGAHATQIMDASQPTFFLSHWVRDRGLFGIEEGIRRVTSDTASLIGLTDRGVVRVGAFADLNVVDLDGLRLPLPEIAHDFPGGSPRFVQRAEGIDHTVVNGRHFLDHGEHTGALAGRLLRG
ncbi:MAG TPA: amidohydrolase family protein [Microthrixaceae bacterium]|nr:amidohydrolase family protein [Microthrixaceae bacterium]